jgi:hypothetical protein
MIEVGCLVTNRWFPMRKIYVVIDEIGETALVSCQKTMETVWAEKKVLKVVDTFLT